MDTARYLRYQLRINKRRKITDHPSTKQVAKSWFRFWDWFYCYLASGTVREFKRFSQTIISSPAAQKTWRPGVSASSGPTQKKLGFASANPRKFLDVFLSCFMLNKVKWSLDRNWAADLWASQSTKLNKLIKENYRIFMNLTIDKSKAINCKDNT
jgi:hypothetical protein